MVAQAIQTDRPLVDAAAAAGGVTRSGAQRLDTIDMLRGLVIALMVLDHVRDFFHATAFTADPVGLDSGDPWLFMTRWITHLCAPTFVFLAGVSVFLQKSNGKTRADLSRFLLTRGLWLIVLELTLVTVGFNFAWGIFLQVIWAIGASMIVMAALIWLPTLVVLGLGASIVAGHQLLAPINPVDVGVAGPAWLLAMEFGPLPANLGFLAYPFVPWLGIMLLGYGLGTVFTRQRAVRDRLLLALGLSLLALFVVIRAMNGYGDPQPWVVQPEPLWTGLSFINVSKYPPSLDYALVTLGLAMLLLVALERLRGPLANVLLTFGRTPLFTYLLHVYVAHALAVIVGLAVGVSPGVFFGMLSDPSRAIAAEWGFGLPVVYAMWVLTLVLLYPVSRWFDGVKRRRRDWWLGYL